MGSAAVRTSAQNVRIWTLVSKLGRASGLGESEVEDIVLRPRVQALSGQDSTARLTPNQARSLIAALESELAGYAASGSRPASTTGRAAQPTRAPQATPAPDARDAERITPAMQEYLAGLYVQAGMTTPAQQRGFSQRQCKRPWPQSQEDADKVIEALKDIILRPHSAESVAARVAALVGHPALEQDEWKAGWVKDVHGRFTRAARTGRMDTVVSTGRLRKLEEIEQFCTGAT